MILYIDNPNLGFKTVTTVSGNTEYRKNCRSIGGKFYTIDIEVFDINGRWYKIDGGNIIFDYEKKAWNHVKDLPNLIKGVVDFEKGVPKVGHFTPNSYNNVKVKFESIGAQTCLNTEILEKNGFVEDVSNGVWYDGRTLGSSTLKSIKIIKNSRNFTDRGYNVEENPDDFRNKVKSYDGYKMKINPTTKKYAKFLGDITWGVELEANKGNVPDHIQNRHGVVICRDGSIGGGPEIVTTPLQGDKGVQNIFNLCSELKTRATVDVNCSMHIHFGNISKDKHNIVSLYVLSRKIQDEIFTMFPYYKTDPRGIKRKNYCKKLDSLSIYTLVKRDKESFQTYLSDSYTKIFNFLADYKIEVQNFNKRTKQHPVSRKWEIASRYRYVNLLNMIFGNRGTAEFRLHQGTLNATKIINWLYICNAIIKYSERHNSVIISTKAKPSMKEVLDIYKELNPNNKDASDLSDYLYSYFLSRQAEFKKASEAGDNVCDWDLEKDKDFTFKDKNISCLAE